MSIFSKIEGFFSAVGSLPGDALKALEAAWHAIQTVWSFLTSSYNVLGEAWTWVVNGAEWFGQQVGDWAGEAFNTLWQTLTQTIPNAIAWVFDQAVKWAAKEIAKIYHELVSALDTVKRYVVKLIHDLVNALKAAFHSFVKWATGSVRWVLHWGAWLIALITHPERLANWIASAIIVPVVKWLLRFGSYVIVWVLRSAASKNSEFAHLIEDVLSDLL